MLPKGGDALREASILAFSCRRKVLMRKSKTKKLLALIMALVMLVGSALPVFAADAETEDAETGVSLQEIGDAYTLIGYESYKTKYNITEAIRLQIVRLD